MNAYQALMKFYPLGLEDLPGELWKPIPGWQDYQESSYGRTKSFHNGKQRIKKPQFSNTGYLRVNLCKNDKQKMFSIHRLVALCFIPNPEGKSEINHRDGNKLNNFVGNLEWATSSENQQHAFIAGLQVALQGEQNPKAKLTSEQAQYIRENPENLKGYELAEMFGISRGKISIIQCGRAYKNAGGSIRQSKCPRLPDEVRSQIRAEYVFGSHEFGSYGLAKKYGVTHRTILKIIHEAQS